MKFYQIVNFVKFDSSKMMKPRKIILKNFYQTK